MKSNEQIPICVDLDGTLITTDSLFEAYFSLLGSKPFAALYSLRLVANPMRFKHELAQHITVQPELLPYNQKLLEWLKAQNRPLCLTTASHIDVAEAVAKHLGIFDNVIGSDETANNKSHQKAKALVATFGAKQFDYVGDSWADIPVWQKARQAIIVSSNKNLITKVKTIADITKIFPADWQAWHIPTWLKTWRAHQWVKNLLVFIPMIAGSQLDNRGAVLGSIGAFISFSAIASSVYIFNDLLDIPSDRNHPDKKHRPIAAGLVSIPAAIISMIILWIAGMSLSLWLHPILTLLLLTYSSLNIIYTISLKKIIIVDILVLALFYMFRLEAGSLASDVPLSGWLLLFMGLLSLSLASAKRCMELTAISKSRKYTLAHWPLLTSLGICSGFGSIAVLVAYIYSPWGMIFYDNPHWLWIAIGLLAIWLGQVWQFILQKKLTKDPVSYALTSKLTFILLIGTIMSLWLAHM